MSFFPKSDAVANAQLKQIEVLLTSADNSIVSASGSDLILQIGEEVAAVTMAIKHKDSDGTVTKIAAANCAIVDSSALTAGGDAKAIKLTSVALASADVLRIVYKAVF